MKRLIHLILFCLVVIIYSCAPSVKEAIAYNEAIIDKHVEIEKSIAYLVDSYDNYVPVEMDSAYIKAHKAAEDGIDFANKLEPFHKDSLYKIAVMGLFKEYLSVIENEHAKMIGLLKLPQDQYQQAQIDEFDQLKSTAEAKIISKIEETAKVQNEFAKKYNFNIENPEEEAIE